MVGHKQVGANVARCTLADSKVRSVCELLAESVHGLCRTGFTNTRRVQSPGCHGLAASQRPFWWLCSMTADLQARQRIHGATWEYWIMFVLFLHCELWCAGY